MRHFGNSILVGLAMLLLLSVQIAFAGDARQSRSKKLITVEQKVGAQRAKSVKTGVRTVSRRSGGAQVRSKPVLKTRSVATRAGGLKAARTSKRMVASARQSRRIVRVRSVAASQRSTSAAALASAAAASDSLRLHSNAAYVIDSETSGILFQKNADMALPIASLTKLMTGLVVVDARQDMNEVLQITTDDRDLLKHTSSRLPFGAKLTRQDMLHIALMSSENRAASALGRHYPGGINAFVAAMNAKAKALGMEHTHYVDATGLSSDNVATARDLAKLVTAAADRPELSRFSTNEQHSVSLGRRQLAYFNSNRLVGMNGWNVELQKTGYISEAGRCLLMQAKLHGRSVIMIFLNAKNVSARVADAVKVRSWVRPRLLNRTQSLATNAHVSQATNP